MKRIIAVVGVVLGLGAMGLTAAHAADTGPSTHCTAGDGGETPIVGWPVAVATETNPSYNNGTIVMVCWSTTPQGSSNPEAAGGQFRVEYQKSSPWDSSLALLCWGDRTTATMITVECDNTIYTTDDHNTSTAGRSASGSSSVGAGTPLGVGRTGVDVSYPVTTTTSSGATPGGSMATGSGTCTYVNGTSLYCPSGTNVAGVNVATGDASVNPATNPGACITAFGNPCWTTAPSGAGVSVAKGDSSNDTVSTTVLGTPVREDLGDCYAYNMPPGTC